MPQVSHHSRTARMAAKMANAYRITDWALNRIDPDGLRHVATVSVRVHWFVCAVMFFELMYRPSYDAAIFAVYVLLFLLLVGFNGYTDYRLRLNRAITWRWILAVCAIDVFLVSAAAATGGGFSHHFMHLFYYPTLAGFAVIFTSFRLNIVWVTMVSVVYLAISLGVGGGLDIEARDEKALLARIAVMYAIVATVNMVSRFERMRWWEAVERERALQRERAELSQAIHDTTAQSAYMVGLGIDTAKALSGSDNPELATTLEATSQLTRSIIWELRHPINMGSIYEGRELSRALRSHTSSFTNITSVPAELTQTGGEPPLSIEASSLLFSIAHNALTNAYRHAEASKVSVHLEYGGQGIRLSVSDDGTGLPEDYAERGHGFANMSRDAERLGGRLVVEERGRLGGATVTCMIPRANIRSCGK